MTAIFLSPTYIINILLPKSFYGFLMLKYVTVWRINFRETASLIISWDNMNNVVKKFNLVRFKFIHTEPDNYQINRKQIC